ncbi:MAG: nucleotidyl transferase AbiEii/AbiGii toxin family protein [Solirubrobacterales bacterium]|nr:nucleotidyl transferase AbiEii/AbiGii toxin family protein [Solirubrobacterales bacterium]
MKYASASAFRDALEARLRQDQTSRVGLSRLRKRVAFERFLARLQMVAPGGWYLKGGFALEMRLGSQARTTRDIDVDWATEESRAVELMIASTKVEIDDPFKFDLSRGRTDEELPGGGQRWSATALLAGREFERIAIDVGFATPATLDPDKIVSSQLLDFAGIAPVFVPTIAIEQHLAEKLHAYTRTYGRGESSSRVKDLVDMAVIARTTSPDASQMFSAAAMIFNDRRTHDLPTSLPKPPDDWRRPWITLVEGRPAGADLSKGFHTAASLWDPVLAREPKLGIWDSESQAFKRNL